MNAVVVFGSINEDLSLSVARAPLPGETVLGTAVARGAGGKGANQAVAAARMGAIVAMVGAVGDDDSGRRQLASLAAAGVDVGTVTVEPASTGLAVITVTETGENSIVVVSGANAHVASRHVDALADIVSAGDVFVAQLEVPVVAVTAALEVARRQGARTVLNAAPMAPLPDLTDLVDVLVVNETEAAELCAALEVQARGHGSMAEELARHLGSTVIVTLGAGGSVVADGGAAWSVPGHAVDVVDTTGAGDTFVGALASGFASGTELRASVELANRAAALACTGAGAQDAMPTLASLHALPR